ncbi:putative nucleic acid-binding protein [Mucilaginibacter gracilis]|uniref:Putative nucleic acid-binding protein n=1 Tax=Mucilaginibacter gracilis TaxID=423350 RepID=A0A495IY96_9SPHI|nr:PIN domain-containing protein [Mucilaginibacter gracilis]RKR81647.1 putative nucleic acid-binding protein [Mucilaginibacter gracilis]
MSDKVFLDTNIVVYSHSDYDLVKQTKAQAIILQQQTIISTQVIQETANTLNKKLKNTWPEVISALSSITNNSEVHTNTDKTILLACTIAEKYRFSFYDCLIIAAALETESQILYSEDMQHNQLIENKLRIVNPFR